MTSEPTSAQKARITSVITLAVATLSAAIEIHDAGTPGHNTRVANLAVAIGRHLGLDASSLALLSRVAPLHDLGKLGISDAILKKPGALTTEEWVIMRTHPTIGLDILDRFGPLMAREKEIILSHHERLDGSGYPRALPAEAQSIEVRIVACSDTYDAMTSNRPYREGFSQEEAFGRLRTESGKTLDSAVVESLIYVVTNDQVRHVPTLGELIEMLAVVVSDEEDFV